MIGTYVLPLDNKLWSEIYVPDQPGYLEKIKEHLGSVTFIVSVYNAQLWKCHTDHLKALRDRRFHREIVAESEGSKESDFMGIL